MSPEMRVRIVGQNATKPAFDAVKQDATTAANAIEASSRRAATGLLAHNSAMTAVGSSTKMAANQQRNLVFQLNDVAVSLAGGANPLLVFAQQGSQIATIYGPEEGGLGKALSETGKMAVGLVTKFWPIAAVVGAGTAAVAGMTHEINKASKVQVSFGDVAMASWQLFSEGVYNLVEPAISQIGTWMGQLWDWAAPGLKALGNGIVATLLGAFDAGRIAWGAFPAVMGDMAYSTANNVIGGIEFMINGAIGLLNDFIGTVNGVAGLDLGEVGTVNFGGLANPYEGAMTGVAKDVAGAFSGAFQNDYLGSAFETIKTRAIELASANETVGKSTKAANDNLKSLDMGLKSANDNAKAFSETLVGELSSGVMSIWQAFRSGENVLEAISNKLMNFGEQLLSNGVQSFFSSIFGGGGGLGGSLFGRPGSFSIGGMPSYADGTMNHPGGWATVGERGIETVWMPKGSQVYPAGSAPAGMGARVIIELGAGLEGRILQQSAAQTVEIVQSQVPGMVASGAPAAVAKASRNKVV